MADQNDKLAFDSISFADVIGDGAPGLESVEEELQDVEAPEPEIEIENELDEDIRERGDEDFEDGVDESYEEEYEEKTVEDEFEEDVAEDVTIADQISDTLGFEMEAQYDDTVEGLTNYVRDISQEIAEDQIQDLFQQFPEVQRHLDYVLAGGESEKFFEAYNPSADYNNFTLTENDSMSQKVILQQYFQLKGHEEAFINEMLEDYEDSGKLYSKAQVAKDSLAQYQEQQRQEMFQQQQAEFEKQEEERAEFWDGVANTLEEGAEFAGIRIPDRDKANFFDYISAPVDDSGRTQRDVDYNEADMDVKLAIDYLMFSGFNLEDIINTKAKTASARNLRDRIVSNQERVKSAKGAQRRKQQAFDPDQLDINALLG
jgi:hypothetical protein